MSDAKAKLPVVELFGGPKDGDTHELEHGVPRELVFPVRALDGSVLREAVYRFGRQMGQGTVRYEWGGYR